MNKKTPSFCLGCNKRLSRRERKRCFPCSLEFRKGENSANWKGGKSFPPNCLDCDKKLISCTSTRCNSCVRSKERSPFWEGGKTFEEYSTDWTETLRRSIRERDNYVCQLCSKQQGDVAHDVHHIDYDKQNCNPSNLITLCHSCHSKTNHKKDYWLTYFKKYE